MKQNIRNLALLFCGVLLFHVAGSWSLPLIDRDEPRFAEASREMLERSDYVVPFFNNRYRFDKPPLTYWVQTTSYRIFGQNDFAARFPSAVAAALTSVLLFCWGKRIGGAQVGWWSALIFTLSLQTFLHAKAAVADMWLVCFVTAAHWAGLELIENCREQRDQIASAENSALPSAGIWWWTFYISLAAGFLAKGPIGLTPLLSVWAIRALTIRVPLGHRFKFGRGTLVTLVLICLWGIPALLRTHGEFFSVGIGRHVIGRSIATMEGHGSNSALAYLLLLPFYFVTVFASFFPWSIKLPRLCRRLASNRDSTDDYLLFGSAVIFVIFTLVKTKLPHYTLPAFPLLALLLARMLPDEPTKRFAVRCAWIGTPIYLAVALFLPPLVAHQFASRDLEEKSATYLNPQMEFAAVDFTEPSLVWYFRSHVRGFMTVLDQKKAQSFMGRPGPRFLIAPTGVAKQVFADLPRNWKMISTTGFNIPKGRRVDLTMVLKPD